MCFLLESSDEKLEKTQKDDSCKPLKTQDWADTVYVTHIYTDLCLYLIIKCWVVLIISKNRRQKYFLTWTLDLENYSDLPEGLEAVQYIIPASSHDKITPTKSIWLQVVFVTHDWEGSQSLIKLWNFYGERKKPLIKKKKEKNISF